MSIETLKIRGFRNLHDAALSLPAGLVAVVGKNGAGKTNLLEAVTVLGNISSFRSSSVSSLVRHGLEGFSLEAVINRFGNPVEIRQHALVGTLPGRGLWRGARRLSAGEYLQIQPVTAFCSRDRQLVVGGPEERRRFLDRIVFHLHPDALATMQTYRHALRQRTWLLSRGGNDQELDAFEHTLAQHGGHLIALRLRVLGLVTASLGGQLGGLGWSLSDPGLRYHAPDGVAECDAAALAQRLSIALAKARRSDRRLGRTSVGPHRHDVLLTLGGRGVREALSAGQAKLLATAMKLAAVRVLEEKKGRVSTLVFDDVDAELDADVLARLLDRLHDCGQVLVSSAHPEMIVRHLREAVVFQVEAGRISGCATGGSVS